MKHKVLRKRKQWVKPVIICSALILAATAGVILFIDYINKQRAEMNDFLEAAVTHVEQGAYLVAQTEANDALLLANKLRENEAAGTSEKIISLIATILNANDFFDSGNYNAALDTYKNALNMAQSINDLNPSVIEKAIADTEMYISFYALTDKAEELADKSEFEAAISVYEEAKLIAKTLKFTEGISLAEEGIEEMHQLILKAKRKEAENLFFQGEALNHAETYSEALIYFYNAMEIYEELDDQNMVSFIRRRIDYAEQKLAAADKAPDPNGPDDIHDGPGDPIEVLSNYDHNINVYFDLKTLIDNQYRRPANLIRMGSREGMNEGWYNGCGWVAVYNALILLGNPQHPADIVRYFEESGGTVLGGMYGTYPNAIFNYMKSLRYDVTHTLFPQITKDLDDEIKKARVGVLAYAHTSAAHYVTIEYNEDLDKFIVYNDSFAWTRSNTLGLTNITSAGAAIDSITALINDTKEILFSFSLIVIG